MAVGKPLFHLDEIYKRDRLDQETPRRGDLVEVVRDHHRSETGAKLLVVNDPHECVVYCAECAQRVEGMFVEVEALEPGMFDYAPGPHFYPIAWLRRLQLN